MINRLHETNASDEALARKVIGLAMKVHRTLGCGFVESIYSKALFIELQRSGVIHQREKVFPVVYEGIEVGLFQADLLIENRIIVELKSVESLAVAHSVQLVNYLAAAGLDFGLLLNFGTKSLQFKTKTRTYVPGDEVPSLQSPCNSVNSVPIP